jgi:hypothetical protein
MRYVTLCDNGHAFNAMYQDGRCPHENVFEQATRALVEKARTAVDLERRDKQIH